MTTVRGGLTRLEIRVTNSFVVIHWFKNDEGPLRARLFVWLTLISILKYNVWI